MTSVKLRVAISNEIARLATAGDFNAYLSRVADMPSHERAHRIAQVYFALLDKMIEGDPEWGAVWRRLFVDFYKLDPKVLDR